MAESIPVLNLRGKMYYFLFYEYICFYNLFTLYFGRYGTFFPNSVSGANFPYINLRVSAENIGIKIFTSPPS